MVAVRSVTSCAVVVARLAVRGESTEVETVVASAGASSSVECSISVARGTLVGSSAITCAAGLVALVAVSGGDVGVPSLVADAGVRTRQGGLGFAGDTSICVVDG